jgi:hypothetical protein
VKAVLIQTFRALFGIEVLLLMAIPGLSADQAPEAAMAVNISVYDDAGVGPETVASAAEEASKIFGQAGIETHWFLCGEGQNLTHASPQCGKAVFPTNLSLRIVRRARGLRAGTFGVAYLSRGERGCYSDIFLEPMQQLQKSFPGGLGNLIGHVSAHEIAHLLLGANSHSVAGLMRGTWQREEWENAEKGRLIFNPSEAAAMNAHILAARQRNEEGSPLAALGAIPPASSSFQQKCPTLH